MGKRPKTPSFESVCRENLLLLAKTYAKATGLSLATISRKSHGQQAFLGEFQARRCSITATKVQEMLDFFSANWPAGLAWPEVKPIPMERTGTNFPVESRPAL